MKPYAANVSHLGTTNCGAPNGSEANGPVTVQRRYLLLVSALHLRARSALWARL